jgi:TatA/E family protein of Tat protein translocase
MGPLGIQELILIVVIALIVFGPRKLPELARSVGKSIGEFRRASNDIKRSIEKEIEQAEETKS